MKIYVQNLTHYLSSSYLWDVPLGQNFDFNLWRDHEKISYERRDYETVDEKSLS